MPTKENEQDKKRSTQKPCQKRSYGKISEKEAQKEGVKRRERDSIKHDDSDFRRREGRYSLWTIVFGVPVAAEKG
ncbi:MAG TPA: hypothetical protein VJJ98_03815 [Sedimentisphaerales bacterium]|nr:hypothetical protein [Sedimentisphaerales bacterium]